MINHKYYGLEKAQPLLRREKIGAPEVFSIILRRPKGRAATIFRMGDV